MVSGFLRMVSMVSSTLVVMYVSGNPAISWMISISVSVNFILAITIRM